MIKEKEYEYFLEVAEERNEDLEEISKLIKNENANLPLLYSDIEFDETILGITNFLINKDVIESKKNFYKATLAREWIYNSYDNNSFKIDQCEVTTYVYKSLFYAILSGSKEKMINLAKLFGGRIEEEKDDYLPNILIGYGLKYLILGDKKNFEKYAIDFESNKNKRGMKQIYEGYYKTYKGILDKDEKIFNEGLKCLLKNHRANMKKNANTIEMYFAYDSIALAILARNQGLEITVKHELLPIEFLEDSLIDYKSVSLFH